MCWFLKMLPSQDGTRYQRMRDKKSLPCFSLSHVGTINSLFLSIEVEGLLASLFSICAYGTTRFPVFDLCLWDHVLLCFDLYLRDQIASLFLITDGRGTKSFHVSTSA